MTAEPTTDETTTTEPTTSSSDPTPDGHAPPASRTTGSGPALRDWVRRVFGLPGAPSRIEHTKTFATPTMDGGFDFNVVVTVVWTTSSERISAEKLQRQVHFHEGPVLAAIEGEIRQVGRCYAPNRAKETEEKLLDRVSCMAREWRFVPDVDGLKWRPRLRVDPDEQVKQLQQEFWVNRLRFEAMVAVSKDHVNALRDLVARWRQLLGDLSMDRPAETPVPYLAPFLVKLATNPDKADETVAGLMDYREDHIRYLLRVVHHAMENQDVNTYEFLTSYESALKLLMEHVSKLPPAVLGEPVTDGNGARDGSRDPTGPAREGDRHGAKA